MSDSKWDDMFKQYSEYEREPANDRWSAIAQELDKDKKRRFGFWWIIGLGSAASIVALLLLFQPAPDVKESANADLKPEEVKSENIASEPIASSEATENFFNSNLTETKQESSTPNIQTLPSEPKPSRSGLAENGIEQSNRLATPSEHLSMRAHTNLKELNRQSMVGWIYSYPVLEAEELAIVYKRPKSILEEEKKNPALEQKTSPNRLNFILGIQTSLAFSNFSPSANLGADLPAYMPDYLNQNLALRNEMEAGGYSVSQGLQFGYQLSKHFSIHTGIRLIQTTQVLNYSLVESTDDPLNAPQDLPEGGKSVSPSYQLPKQRIIPGQDYRIDNKYYGREIPLSIQMNVSLLPKLRLIGQVGGSYRWVTSGILFFPDIDNVGMLSLNNPSDYPGIRSTWHTHLGVGISYELKHGFRINAMPYANIALNSNIRFNRFIQQRQQEFGLNISLVRNIQFGQ